MHQINLERMSPVVHALDGVAFPDTLVGTDSHTPHVDALGVIAIGVGGLEAESVMLGRASWMRLPDIIGVELTGKLQPGRSEEHTSELQSLMRISYAVFCLDKKNKN